MKSNDKFGRSIRRGNMSILRYFIEKYFFEILAYILLSIGFFGIFKKMEIENNWGAFIPFYRYYLLCNELKRPKLFTFLIIATFGYWILLGIGVLVFVSSSPEAMDGIVQRFLFVLQLGFGFLFAKTINIIAILLLQYFIGERLALSFGKQNAVGYAIGYAIIPFGFALFFGYNTSEYKALD